MLTLDQTNLETFNFGETEEDKFYVLVNTVKNPEGINVAKLAMADPRMFDSILSDMGCILMLSGVEINELVARGALKEDALHESLYQLAKQEGVIS